ncbi:MAG TPA: hypothetical protein DDW76_16900 [Cyanobacteria bacterium UBA11369]|nr:hypothetical protein [Cyanobacteria bacterium UBA11371]HBE35798.1 hypothetical protein [Cyanobacteria bacterium UBA11368]HBE50423.1 hypothetical protein [Cyanobacteria bacterium UBA11369]
MLAVGARQLGYLPKGRRCAGAVPLQLVGIQELRSPNLLLISILPKVQTDSDAKIQTISGVSRDAAAHFFIFDRDSDRANCRRLFLDSKKPLQFLGSCQNGKSLLTQLAISN